MSFSLYLFKLGIAPQIQDLYGKVEFTGINVFSPFIVILGMDCLNDSVIFEEYKQKVFSDVKTEQTWWLLGF